MEKTKEQRNLDYLQGLRAKLQAERVQLVNLMVSERDNKPYNPDTDALVSANDALAAAYDKVDSFLKSPTAQRWREAK